MRYEDMTDDERLNWARRFRDPGRRAKAEAKVLEDIAARSPGSPEHTQRRHRPAGGGTLKKGS